MEKKVNKYISSFDSIVYVLSHATKMQLFWSQLRQMMYTLCSSPYIIPHLALELFIVIHHLALLLLDVIHCLVLLLFILFYRLVLLLLVVVCLLMLLLLVVVCCLVLMLLVVVCCLALLLFTMVHHCSPWIVAIYCHSLPCIVFACYGLSFFGLCYCYLLWSNTLRYYCLLWFIIL